MGKKLPFDMSKLKSIRRSNLLIALLAGVLLLVIGIPTPSPNSDPGMADDRNGGSSKEGAGIEADTSSYQESLEKQLAGVLSAIDGAGQVEVMITLQDAGELVLNKDLARTEESRLEEDGHESRRSSQSSSLQESTVNSQQGSGYASPFVSREMKPRVEGVLVVAQGGGNPAVAKNISEAVLALFSIDAHRIKVVKSNTP